MKKKIGILLGIFVLLFSTGSLAATSQPTLKLEQQKVTTDAKGKAIIKGSTTSKTEVTAASKKVTVKNNKFRYIISLKNNKSKTIKLTATKGKNQTHKQVKVIASKDFKKKLAQEEAQRKEEATAALILAERTPTREYYAAADCQINTLSSKHLELSERLAKVKETVDRNERNAQQTAEAEKAVSAAEKNPTNDTYNAAIQAIQAIPDGNSDLTQRATSITNTLNENEKEAQEQANRAAATQNSQSSSDEQQYVDANGNGLIKGSSAGIYHIPGSTYYNRTTKPVAWFKTVSEAVNAGYRAPER
ncbi:hypothetical protein ACFFIF_02700 [Vagococcus entomophilus]|uniref:Surface layer protein A domain-containing protein n=1 Tax=Vagococcus entomophilus TaxID=1160095 RepID=A0A430AJR0_9ENTE|nr:hypothetical protein [Vagococcus entomophilus]RSU08298.1 hypothetical protein CBF30_03390 [Vagococcus entomophilus]